MDNQKLFEKYRPRDLHEVEGQTKAVKKLEFLGKKENGWLGRAFWITGKSGTGKTTIAKIVAGTIAEQLHTHETTGRELTLNELRKQREHWGYCTLGTLPGHCLIVNEAHGLSKSVIEPLLNTMEDMACGKLPRVTILFTTTREGSDAFEEQFDSAPFLSRCIDISLTTQKLADSFAARVFAIAEMEGLAFGKSLNDFKKLANQCKSNMRLMLNKIESGEML